MPIRMIIKSKCRVEMLEDPEPPIKIKILHGSTVEISPPPIILRLPKLRRSSRQERSTIEVSSFININLY